MPEVTPLDDAQTALDKLRGNWTIDNVEEALVVLSNEERGRFVVGLFDEGVPADVLRAAVESAWNHDYTVLWEACGASISVVRELFRAAKFDKSRLPKSLEIWRGGVIPPGGHWHDVAFGISWTRNRDAACWFAIHYWGTRFDGEPVVLKRTIERRYVLAHITSRDENEIVTTTTRPTEVDGSLKEWRAAADRYEKSKKAAEKARLATLVQRKS